MIFTWFSVISALLQFANRISDYAQTNQLLKAGEAQAIARMHQEASERIARAIQARDAMDADLRDHPDRVRAPDENQRD